jgi:hypothetical protein
MTEDICARESLARQQGCIEAMQDDIHELKEGVIALRHDSQETWKVVNRIEAKMDAESHKRQDCSHNADGSDQSSSDITLSIKQVVILVAAFVFVILLVLGYDIGAFI